MREVVFRPEVDNDIEEIADYTIAQWGHEQAFFYISELRAALDGLSRSAMRHPQDNALHAGLRRMRVSHHFVYYLVVGETVEVIRILHEKRDPRRHLKQS